MPDLVPMLAQVLGIGSASGSRTMLALFVVALLGRAGYVKIPDDLSLLTSTPMLGALLAGVILEECLERDDDAQRVLAALKYFVHGAGGAFASYVLIDSAKLPFEGWPIAIIGCALALATNHLRMRLHRALDGIAVGLVSPRRWLSWLEAGGVVGVAAAVVLAPLIAFAFVMLALLATAVFWALSRIWEHGFRRPCPRCQTAVRKEARICRRCRVPLPVATAVGQDLFDDLGAEPALGGPHRR